MDDFFSATSALITLAILIGLFFALREVWCWYLKLNKIIENQEKQARLLKSQVDILGLMALKNGVPDKKIEEVLNGNHPIMKTVTKDWIESNRERKQNNL